MAQAPKKPDVERAIDENLRRAYEKMVDEKVPERFLNLLDQLRDGNLPPTRDDEDPSSKA
ncbi:NepR family anti-sigma factor [Yoonia sp. SS1-5]|uniref:NepR family anti-sigma factor n=1 Tax=Yoonia rhodophyticola TaxID=3137370 RepID=A0AAN0MC73_9RHOB